MSVASPQPEPGSHDGDEASPQPTAGSVAAPSQPSRQDLVMKPRGPSPWMAVGVVSCGLLGFATAFFLEIGRSRGGHAQHAAVADAPEVLPTEAVAEPIAATTLASGAETATAAGYPSEMPATEDRYAAFEDDRGAAFSRFGGGQLTAAVETPSEAVAAESAIPDTDRFSQQGGTPAFAPAAESGPGVVTVRKPPVPFEPPASADLPPLTYAEEEVPPGDALGNAAEPVSEDVVDADLVSSDGDDQDLLAPLPEEEAAANAVAPWEKTTDVAADELEAPEAVDLEALGFAEETPPAAAAENRNFRAMADVQPGFATPVVQSGPAVGATRGPLAFDDPDAPIAVTPPSTPPAFGQSAAAEAEVDTPPADSRYAASDALRAFGGTLPERPMLPSAAAPEASLIPEPAVSAPTGLPVASSLQEEPMGSPAFPGAGPGYGVTGVGRPGPALLEGVQSPQVAVEKRGPREVQVGKFARYEILVRNLGSVTAHEVELFDTVPQGTSLVSTTPPAAPGAQGELTWQLGSLGPGEQARVLVEVLPTEEGEVGSVASVRFAAKASVRSLATRPALAMEIEQPPAMRIGGEVPLVITVSNPGTGRATGVVLEGVLPEGLTHRAGRELEFDIGSLKPGESRSIDLVLATTGPGLHRMDVGVRGDGQLEERQSVSIEVTAPTLELTAELPSRRYLQRPVTCVLSMANSGTAAARSVELAAQLPPGLKFVQANNAGYYDEKNHRVLWQLEELPPAEVGSVEVVLMPIALGSQQVVAAARSPDGLSDQVTHVLEVEGVAALTFSVIDSEDPIEVDGLTEYVIRIGNQGTKAADSVQVTASMLGDLQPVDASGPVGHRVENLTVVFEPLARLAPTEEAVFRVQARGRRAGDQRMQVQVTSADHQTPVTKEEVTRVYADR